jgi:hypothetical protein
VSEAAVWLLHPSEDRVYPIEFAIEHRDFWVDKNGCTTEEASPLTFEGMMADDLCEAYSCSGPPMRFCSYTASVGRDPPAYFASSTVAFLQSLL